MNDLLFHWFNNLTIIWPSLMHRLLDSLRFLSTRLSPYGIEDIYSKAMCENYE